MKFLLILTISGPGKPGADLGGFRTSQIGPSRRAATATAKGGQDKTIEHDEDDDDDQSRKRIRDDGGDDEVDHDEERSLGGWLLSRWAGGPYPVGWVAPTPLGGWLLSR